MIGMRRISQEREGGIGFFRPARANPRWDADPRLTPWAAFFRRFAAGLLGALRGIFDYGCSLLRGSGILDLMLPCCAATVFGSNAALPKQATASCLFEHIRALVVGPVCCRAVRSIGGGLRGYRHPQLCQASSVLRTAALWLERRHGAA